MEEKQNPMSLEKWEIGLRRADIKLPQITQLHPAVSLCTVPGPKCITAVQ